MHSNRIRSLATSFLLTLAASPFAMAQELLSDGTFELGSIPNCVEGRMPDTWYIVWVTPDTYSFAGCGSCTPGSEGLCPTAYGNYSSLPAAHSGQRFASAWSAVPEVFGTTPVAPLLAGHRYRIRVWLAGPNTHSAAGWYDVRVTNDPFTLYSGAVVAQLGQSLSIPTGAWVQDEIEFVAPAEDDLGQPAAAWTELTMTPGGTDAYIATDDWSLVELSDPSVYCTAKVNSQGCTPSMQFAGFASASDSAAFTLSASSVLNNKSGLLFYGFDTAAIPFQGGTLCVAPPIERTPVQGSGGNPPPNDCSGTLSFDFNAWIQSGQHPELVPSTSIAAQYWYRDPLAASTTGLTDAVLFAIRP